MASESLGSQAIWARVPTLAEPVTLEASSLWLAGPARGMSVWTSGNQIGAPGVPGAAGIKATAMEQTTESWPEPGALAAGLAVGKMRGPLTVVGCLGDRVCWPFRRLGAQPT